jgi:hypothetical protein
MADVFTAMVPARHRPRRHREGPAVVGTFSLPRIRSVVPGVLLLASVLAVAPAGPAEAASRPSLNSYQGLGTWVDMYDRQLWRGPEAIVADMHAHGVRTLFLETGNWRIDRTVFKPAIVARYLDAAHAQGMKVVAWYVPDFRTRDRDLTRSLAAIGFTTPTGERFDSFGLDIESPEVRDPAVRTARMLRLSRQIREAVGPSYPLAAIVPSPYALQLIPTYWPGFPFGELVGLFDVFVPMGYFTFRTNGPTEAAAYTTATLRLLSDRTGGAPIHAIGGLAENTSGSEVRAYVQAALGQGVIGASLYDFGTTGPEDWAELAAIESLAPKPPPPPAKTKPRVAIRDAPPLPFSLRRSHLLAR